jgi:6-phosphogluconolactonase
MDSVKVFADADELATAARDYVLSAAKQSIAERGVFNLDLAGGSTPRKLYELLAAQQADWQNWHFFMGDERYVPLDDERSNYQLAHDALLSKLPIQSDQVHIVPVDLPAAGQVAERYEEQIRQHFHAQTGVPAFDLVLLGLGSDTHTASLFPGKSAVKESKRLVVASEPGTVPPLVDRVTFTLPLINAARRVLFLVTGADKAEAFRAVHRDLELPPEQAATPAGKVRPTNGELLWFVDRAAANATS